MLKNGTLSGGLMTWANELEAVKLALEQGVWLAHFIRCNTVQHPLLIVLIVSICMVY